MSSSDVGKDEKKGSGGWWDWHPSKTALEYLWRSGTLQVVRREGFRKYYDLTEDGRAVLAAEAGRLTGLAARPEVVALSGEAAG